MRIGDECCEMIKSNSHYYNINVHFEGIVDILDPQILIYYLPATFTTSFTTSVTTSFTSSVTTSIHLSLTTCHVYMHDEDKLNSRVENIEKNGHYSYY